MPDRHIQAPPTTALQVRLAFTSAAVDAEVVRSAVHAYVDDMKLLGASVERVIVEIKRLAEIEDGPLYRATMRKDRDDIRDARSLVDNAVRWCIERYYGARDSRGAENPVT